MFKNLIYILLNVNLYLKVTLKWEMFIRKLSEINKVLFIFYSISMNIYIVLVLVNYDSPEPVTSAWLLLCNVYFPVGSNIICLRWYCIHTATASIQHLCSRKLAWGGNALLSHLDAFILPQLLQRLCYLIKHTSQSPTRDLIIWGSLGGFMKVTWMLTWGQTLSPRADRTKACL